MLQQQLERAEHENFRLQRDLQQQMQHVTRVTTESPVLSSPVEYTDIRHVERQEGEVIHNCNNITLKVFPAIFILCNITI